MARGKTQFANGLRTRLAEKARRLGLDGFGSDQRQQALRQIRDRKAYLVSGDRNAVTYNVTIDSQLVGVRYDARGRDICDIFSAVPSNPAAAPAPA